MSNIKRMIEIAESILSGETGIIEGSRELASLSRGVEQALLQEDILTFVGIDSQTDHLPIGTQRTHWNAEALKNKDIEIAECEAFFREQAYTDCFSLLQHFKDQ